MQYTIQKNIPIPSRRQSTGRNNTYPFKLMQIGDSFIISKIYTQKLHSKYTALCRGETRRHGTTFTTRKTKTNQIRVWRTS